jgi:hypothetical protein
LTAGLPPSTDSRPAWRIVPASAAAGGHNEGNDMKALALIAVVVALAASASSALAGGFITDTLAPGGGNHSAPAQSYRFITDTLAPGGGSASVTTASASRFSWADAGIGAGMAAGALLALLGGVLVVNRRSISVAV